jgi:formylglycine-generating enzyme required for sulfatase activity
LVSLCCFLLAISGQAEDAPPDPLAAFLSEMVAIKPGTDPFPLHFTRLGERVAFNRPPFSMQKYEVTQSLYEAVMGKNPSRWRGPRNSVEMVHYSEAEEFCDRLTERLRERGLLTNGQRIRLPTPGEWEYCCRADSDENYCFGNGVKLLGDYAWYKENAAGNDPPVGAKLPNRWGLHDMHGYVWEWCDAEDDAPPTIHGGAWTSTADECRASSAQVVPPGTRRDDIGFRCVLQSKLPDEK